MPKGRKSYVHRQGTGSNQAPWFTNHPRDELKQKLRVHPLRRGLTFYFHVDFENLSRASCRFWSMLFDRMRTFATRLALENPWASARSISSLSVSSTSIEPEGTPSRQLTPLSGVTTLCALSGRIKFRRISIPENPENSIHSRSPILHRFRPGVYSETSARSRCRLPFIAPCVSSAEKSAATHPVHTPQLSQGDPEIETYQWFVRNDDKNYPDDRRECLRPITGNQLPTLRD